MSSTILQLNDLTLALLMTLLDGVKGLCWIVVEIATPVREGSETPYLRISGNHETVPALKTAAEAIAKMVEEPYFRFTLNRNPVSTEEDALAFGMTTLVQAPNISPETWDKMPRRERQQVVMREIFKQTTWNIARLRKVTGAASSHISNITHGNRNLSANFASKLISTLPLSDEMITKIREAASELH